MHNVNLSLMFFFAAICQLVIMEAVYAILEETGMIPKGNTEYVILKQITLLIMNVQQIIMIFGISFSFKQALNAVK